MSKDFTRREFLKNSRTLGAASLFGIAKSSAAEPPPETTVLKIEKYPVSCIAPQFVAEALLRAEGFADLQYVEVPYEPTETAPFTGAVGPGKADFTLDTGHAIMSYLDAGAPVRVLAGLHLGCYELFGSERVKSIRDLKDKTVPVEGLGASKHVLLSIMTAYVGLDPAQDIDWIAVPSKEAVERYAAGEFDAFLGFPPEPQALRARGIGDVIMNSGTDKPWSQYYCCMLLGNSEFVRKYPIATKRVVRAILKAADVCARDPLGVARLIVDKGFVPNYEYTLQALQELPYDVWRTYNPEDTLRFYGLRLHDVGLIKSHPNELIARGADWRFLNELKRELKA